MQENFDRAFQHLLIAEGFMSNLKYDSPTVFGINSEFYQKVYDDVMVQVKADNIDNALLMAKKFYHDNYWVPEGCDTLAYPLDIYVFIEAVNTEGARCHKERDLAKRLGTPQAFLQAMDQHYRAIVAAHPEKAIYLRGWENRLANVEAQFPWQNVA